LPDGSILTAYGTGYRSEPNPLKENQPGPRDAAVIQWRPQVKDLGPTGPVTAATIESDTRNVFDPSVLKTSKP
jgi:hypothetical protein